MAITDLDFNYFLISSMPSDKNRIFLLALAALVGAAALYMNANKGADYPVASTSNQEGIVTNTASADTITTTSGFQYRIITEGSGTESPGPSTDQTWATDSLAILVESANVAQVQRQTQT